MHKSSEFPKSSLDSGESLEMVFRLRDISQLNISPMTLVLQRGFNSNKF